MVDSNKAPDIWRKDGGIVPRFPVNEMKKSGQKPKRILPYLPRVGKELLRWRIHPERILWGAASVSHLFS